MECLSQIDSFRTGRVSLPRVDSGPDSARAVFPKLPSLDTRKRSLVDRWAEVLSLLRARSETVLACLQRRPSVSGLGDKRQHQAPVLSSLQAAHLSRSPRHGGLGLPAGGQMYRCILEGVSSHTPAIPTSPWHLFLCIPCSCNTVCLHALCHILSIRTEKFKYSG